MQQYADKLRQFVMGHTEDVLKNPRSFIRYPFIDPGSYMTEMSGTGIPTGRYSDFQSGR